MCIDTISKYRLKSIFIMPFLFKSCGIYQKGFVLNSCEKIELRFTKYFNTVLGNWTWKKKRVNNEFASSFFAFCKLFKLPLPYFSTNIRLSQ